MRALISVWPLTTLMECAATLKTKRAVKPQVKAAFAPMIFQSQHQETRVDPSSRCSMHFVRLLSRSVALTEWSSQLLMEVSQRSL